MYISTITISPKGQIVLPKKIRNILGSNTVSLLVNDQNQILLTPLNELGGVFSSYSKDTALTFDQIREKSWQDSIAVKTDNSSDGK